MSECSGGRERSEQSGASEGSGASEQANGRVSGPVLTSLFLFNRDHSGMPFDEGTVFEGAW